jgi:HPt (histidine-containing phosphotransfer) domain-containing protein
MRMSDLFSDRMAALRERFSGQLIARIDGIGAVAPQLGGAHLDVLAQAHRDAHHLCGVGASLGFAETGKAARSIEQLLLAAVRAERALTSEELSRLRAGIALLRSTASAEMGAARAVLVSS